MTLGLIDQNKALAKEMFDAAFIKYDVEKTRSLITDEYIQHNPIVPSGAEPFLHILPMLKEQNMEFTNQRLFADDHYIVSHNAVNNVPITGYQNVVTFDVWRVENGRLAEHWDNVGERSDTPNPAGRYQYDGVKEIVDPEKTDENKAFAQSFLRDVLIAGDISKAGDYISSEQYAQHSIDMDDGLDSFVTRLTERRASGEAIKYEKIHLAVAEGNFAFFISEGKIGEAATSFHDLFRIENGKIVEHWDVIETIPTEWAHGNGKF